MQTGDERYKSLLAAFRALGQEHVFACWDSLDARRRRDLLDDLDRIHTAELPRLAELAAASETKTVAGDALQPADVIRREAVPAEVAARGAGLLAAGKVAALTVAGGQGTRLGFDGPKGAFPISPVRNKPLFQLFAEAIRATGERFGHAAHWYIMTSPLNHDQTRRFFEENAYFGLSSTAVTFFQQGVVPVFDPRGKVLLDRPHRLALSPDGHGGTLLALAATGMLEDMAARGIEIISDFQVDNPLVRCLDPVFIGLHDRHGSEMSSKAVTKADDLEHVGNFVLRDGRLVVIEYTEFNEMPGEPARARNEDGSRRFDAGNIAIHLLSRSFVERLTADAGAFALPWHRARKKVPHLDLATGRRVEPDEPNAVKLEAFIFDALPLAENPILLETSRAEEFSPVKNPTGVDSVETARRDMNRRAARWLELAGFSVPRDDSGEPAARLEISPLVALESDDLTERKVSPQAIQSGDAFYLENSN